MRRYLLLVFIVWLAACSAPATPVPATATIVFPTATIVTPTLLPTQTLQPYEEYTIDYLRQRIYGGGNIEVLEKLSETDLFTGYSIRYPSDGLNIYGFVNVPKGTGPFPMIVSVHGYAVPGGYDPFNIESDYADFFAANRFIVVHPGLRNQPPSDNGDNLLRVGMSVDVLNLIALLRENANLPVELRNSDPENLGLWGNSLGGEIALRILTVSPDVKATVLYSPLSGNEEQNSQQLYAVLQDEQFQLDSQVPVELLDRISSMNYYYKITSAIQLNHGTADTTAPMSWAAETCDFLAAAGVSVQCIYYQDADHVFQGEDSEKLLQSALGFYQTHLAP